MTPEPHNPEPHNPETPRSDPHQELLTLASTLAVQAGGMIRSARQLGTPDASTKSSDVDMVTEFDRAAERLIVDGLIASRPSDGIIGEEGSSRSGTTGVVWHIDPIDGTTNFLYALPGYAVSIGAIDQQGPLLGAVYIPATSELFTAIRGGGAFLNGHRIHCSLTTELRLALVATGLAYMPQRRAVQMDRLARVCLATRDIRRLGAASVDLCYVAAGRLDAYFEEWLSSWDMAAGELIAREAGCLSGSINGGSARPESLLVANPHLFEPMVTLLNQGS